MGGLVGPESKEGAAVKYRWLIYLRPTGAQTTPQLIRGAVQDGDSTDAVQVRTEATAQMMDRLYRFSWVVVHIGDGRMVAVCTADIQTSEIEVIE